MNIQKIASVISEVDPEVYDKMADRRSALKSFGGMTAKIAAVAMPFALGSFFKKAYGQSTGNIVGVLNYALTLEYLEAEFYKQAAAATVVVAADKPGINTIRDHEIAHVNFLRNTITSLGGTPVMFTAANFDFTAGGAYATVFTNYDTLLAVAQAFEDTGVRAYKGQATNLMSNDAVLQAALQIHSVEARHAAHIRKLRRDRGATANKPWITGNDAGGVPGVAAVYAGEENVTQAGVNITSFGVSSNAASEAFDEPLTQAQVLAIVDPFII